MMCFERMGAQGPIPRGGSRKAARGRLISWPTTTPATPVVTSHFSPPAEPTVDSTISLRAHVCVTASRWPVSRSHIRTQRTVPRPTPTTSLVPAANPLATRAPATARCGQIGSSHTNRKSSWHASARLSFLPSRTLPLSVQAAHCQLLLSNPSPSRHQRGVPVSVRIVRWSLDNRRHLGQAHSHSGILE